MGRSRGGLSTKIHLLADTRCRPLVRLTTAGQRHDALAFEPLMNRLRIRRSGAGRPRTRPDRLLADKAYSNRKTRAHLRRRGIIATIPEKTDQQKTRTVKGSAGGRPPAFTCADAGLSRRFRRRPTSRRPGPRRARPVAGHRHSMRRPTRNATPSNARSTSSRTSVPSRCAPTNVSSSSAAPSTSPRSRSGYATPPTKIRETRPRDA